jgi:hypothetical protein
MTKNKTFRYKFDHTLVSSILNTIYAIFLGLLFTFFVQLKLDIDGKVKEIGLMVSLENASLVSILALYFIFDWFSTNITIKIKDGFNNLLLIIFVILIVFLGVMVILAFDPNPNRLYWLFGFYAVIVTGWDILLSNLPNLKKNDRILIPLLIYSTVIARFSIGIFILFYVSFVSLFRPDDKNELLNHQTMLYLLTVYLIVKFLRYYVYVFCFNSLESNENE